MKAQPLSQHPQKDAKLTTESRETGDGKITNRPQAIVMEPAGCPRAAESLGDSVGQL